MPQSEVNPPPTPPRTVTPKWAEGLIKRVPMDGNPLWPLPPDYFDLNSADAQRRARVNACRQYLLDWGSTRENARAFARCIAFFDREYLWPDPDSDFYPNFYDQEPLPEAPFHSFMQEAYWMSTWMVMVAPRGGTKTMQILKRTLLRMVAERGFSCVYATSTHSLARQRGGLIRSQLSDNERIQADWVPEYGGRLTPSPRSGLAFNTEEMRLYNGGVVICASAFQRQRGFRPITYELDDPEYDPQSRNTDLEALREEMSEVLFRIIAPMMNRPQARLPWTGTFISPQHLLWSAIESEKQADGSLKPADPKFAEWDRYVIKAAQEDYAGQLTRSNWPHMWPLDDAERDRLGLHPTTHTLHQIRKQLGEPVFQAEMQANPGVIRGSYFPFNRASEETRSFYGYTLTDEDEYTRTDPLRTSALVNWTRWDDGVGKPLSFPLSEMVQQCRTFITIDTAYSTSNDSDWKVAHVFLWTPVKELFSLDIYDTHEEEFIFAKNILRLAEKWRSYIIYPEVTNTQQSLFKTLRQYAGERMTEQFGINHVPGVMPLHTGRESKTSRIASFRVWFDMKKVKLPLFMAHNPSYARLFDQIEGFSPEVRQGGLRKDDHLDTLEMAQRTVKVSTERLILEADPAEGVDPLARLRAGERYDPKTGLPWAAYLDPSRRSTEELMEAAYLLNRERKNHESLA